MTTKTPIMKMHNLRMLNTTHQTAVPQPKLAV